MLFACIVGIGIAALGIAAVVAVWREAERDIAAWRDVDAYSDTDAGGLD